jgi:predicted ATP-grasp superfamily ATP-dependent carboligase
VPSGSWRGPLSSIDRGSDARKVTPLAASATKELVGVRAIVTDAQSRLGLYVIRALGRAGCRVTAIANTGESPVIGFSSRYASESLQLPPGPYEETLPAAVDMLAPRHDVLIPVSAFSITVMARAVQLSRPDIGLFIPTLDAFQMASDKRAVTRAAIEAGVPVPQTFEGPGEAGDEVWAARLAEHLPLVVKFSDEERSTNWAPADRYRIVRTERDLLREYRRMDDIASAPLVQEYVEGSGFGFFTLIGPAGEQVGSFCHRRLREYPITGGPSTLCESVFDPELIELGSRILRHLDWRGIAMVEFKQDRRTGAYRLLEINPRFWGSLPLSIQCGLNFPVYQAQIALGMEPTPPESYPVGRRMRFLFSDLLAARAELRRDRSFRAAARYLVELFNPSIRDGLIELDDPRPVLTYLRDRAFG